MVADRTHTCAHVYVYTCVYGRMLLDERGPYFLLHFTCVHIYYICYMYIHVGKEKEAFKVARAVSGSAV